MGNDVLKKMIARASVVACLLAMVALALTLFASKYTPPLRYAANVLTTIAAGYNVYFLVNWFRSVTQPDGRFMTIVIGVAWLVICVALGFVAAVSGFAECAGGCSDNPPSASDWYGALALLGIAVVFNGLLSWVRSTFHYSSKSR